MLQVGSDGQCRPVKPRRDHLGKRYNHRESAIPIWIKIIIVKFFSVFLIEKERNLEQLVKDLSRSNMENEDRDVSGSTKTEKPSGSWSQVS